MARLMKAGPVVRVVGIPPDLEDFPDFPTKSTFERCLGHSFVIQGINVAGKAELPIGSVTGNPHERIWIAPCFLEPISKWAPMGFKLCHSR